MLRPTSEFAKQEIEPTLSNLIMDYGTAAVLQGMYDRAVRIGDKIRLASETSPSVRCNDRIAAAIWVCKLAVLDAYEERDSR